MRIGMKRGLCILMVAALVAVAIPKIVSAVEDGVTVTTREEFMSALQQKKSPIIVNDLITIGKDVDTDNRMLPVKIPAGTVIRGEGSGFLDCRCPIQLEGDVCFQDIRLTFESTNALGSVPHREIFLAGHSLTLDNVNTWLEGGGNELGPLGGNEKELLPTVYAGGYTNTAVGENASLTVRNSNDKTILQAVYMGHGAGDDNKVPYQGTAVLNLDTKLTVREGVDVSQNSRADITISGGANDYAKTKQFYGNAKTTLTVRSCSISDAVVENIGNIILADRACLYAKTSSLGNVTLQQGGCLDLTKAEPTDVRVSGNFSGVADAEEERGVLVVNPQSSLLIEGEVTGTTWFQTVSRFYPGYFVANWPYISANKENAVADNFVLSENSIENGYQLNYSSGTWTAAWENQGEAKAIGGIEILSAPSQVVLGRIGSSQDGTVPDENIYFEIIWRDMGGTAFSVEEAEELGLYMMDYVFKVKAEYWDSDDPDILARTDWGNAIWLMTSEEHPGKYFLEALEGAKTGEYVFLFCSEYCDDLDSVKTVQDVKDLANLIKAESRVTFLDKEPEVTATPTPVPTARPTPTPTAGAAMTPAPTVTLPTVTPTMAPTQIPTLIPTAEPTTTPALVPTAEPTTTPALVSTATPAPEPTPSGIKDKTPPVSVVDSPEKLTLSADRLVYTGKAQKPKVIVTDTRGGVISSTNYRLSYQNNVKAGIASVTVRFRGNYSGTMSKTFQIVPKGTRISRLTGRSKGFLVRWKKQRTQTTGYQIQYSTGRKFSKKKTKCVTIKGNKKISRKISGRKPGKKYYVRVRTYKSVRAGGRTRKIYSNWSRIKTVKVRK